MLKISRKADSNIFPDIVFIIIFISNLYDIPYNLSAKTLYITYLYVIQDKHMTFALLIILANHDNISLLFVNEKSIKTTSFNIS